MSEVPGPAPRRPVGRGPRLLAVQGAGRLVGWSLAAGNGRQLAMSARLYRSESELVSALRELLIERASLRYAFVQDRSRAWCWSAYLPPRTTRPDQAAEEPIARSARGYLRRDQCRQGVESFRSGLNALEWELRTTGREGRWPW
ncbi:hypothetical protein [Kitasatospora kifunensis]|uniref:Uncharacterized protein YegP (UPF0339 family) n=1 Tax=Kitasatospora kifunensis TaxID=58351 RepID=A0A7W7R3Q5_KITKI|nr:hypothetical protein [Kitasatospora kifunensis]MBB4924341.1 uncharacterized protein YegP (UPF0339 family) [Kitasatospora kifunensis]